MTLLRKYNDKIIKTSWGEGPWQNEPDFEEWIDDKTKLVCHILRHSHSGALCGYVGIPPDHPFYEMSYGDIHSYYDINVHGGLTFSGFIKDDKYNLWWIGFDCNHSGDFAPAYPKELSYVPYMNYKDWSYVARQVYNLSIDCACNYKVKPDMVFKDILKRKL